MQNLPVWTATAKSALSRTARVRTCYLTVQTTKPHMFRPKRRIVWMLDTENVKLEENLQKSIFS